MIRETVDPRDNWYDRLTERFFEAVEGPLGQDPYWRDDALYRFSEDQILMLEAKADELHGMCMQAVQHVIDHNLYYHFGLSPDVGPYIARSWEYRDPHLYGRFDFSYDREGQPKLLEYNADTPTSVYEASVLQWDVLKDRGLPDQFNLIHERLVARWQDIQQRYTVPQPLYFACETDLPEDFLTTCYLRDTAHQAGLDTQGIDLRQIGWNGQNFTDLEENDIKAFFKLYPWEMMFTEEFGRYVMLHQTGVIEPPWKALLSNKALLPILWSMYPDHPNLLPAYFDARAFNGAAHVRKPKYGRGGQSIQIVKPGSIETAPGGYGQEGYVYQAYHALPSFDDGQGGTVHPVTGVWVIGDEASGMGIREDYSEITQDRARFVPHYFIPSAE